MQVTALHISLWDDCWLSRTRVPTDATPSSTEPYEISEPTQVPMHSAPPHLYIYKIIMINLVITIVRLQKKIIK